MSRSAGGRENAAGYLAAGSRQGYRSRARRGVLVLAMLAIASGLVWKTFDLQFRDRDRILAWADDHRFAQHQVMGVRGDILDRTGEPLATSVEWSAVYADPARIPNPLDTAGALAPVLESEVAPLAEQLSAPGRFVYLRRQVPPEAAEVVEDLDLAGVGTIPELRRVYPLGPFAAEVVGSVSTDHSGISGVEKLHNDLLAASDGLEVREVYPGGRSVPGGLNRTVSAVNGSDLRLTVDRLLQFEAGRVLSEQVRLTEAAGGVILLSRPATGEILAMVTATRDEDGQVVTGTENKAITWAYEPGSALKGVTFAAVLDAGLASPESSRSVPDRLVRHDSEFSDYSPHPVLDYTVRDILVQSSNIGTILWSEELGADRLDAYLRRFGFGSASGLGLYGESPGLLPQPEDWSGTSLATIAIGQGVSVTPLQLLQAFNVIANDGVYVPARVVADATAPDGTVTDLQASAEPRRVVSAAAAIHVRRMLWEAVEFGTGGRASVEGYEVAGKTGTARKPRPSGGYEDAEGNYNYIATFVGFLPASDPQLSLVVVIDEPRTTILGGTAAAPLFAELAEIAVRRLKVPPPAAGAPDAPELILASTSPGAGRG